MRIYLSIVNYIKITMNMDIGQLFFEMKSKGKRQLNGISHFPSYVIRGETHHWYFWKQGITYRKKTQNTSLQTFYNFENQQTTIFIQQLQTHQIMPFTINSIHKATEIIQKNHQNNSLIQIFILPRNNRYFNIQWDQTQIQFSIKLSSSEREALIKYVQTIVQYLDQKNKNNKIQSLSIIFNRTIDATIRSLLICNIKYIGNPILYSKLQNCYFFKTNLKQQKEEIEQNILPQNNIQIGKLKIKQILEKNNQIINLPLKINLPQKKKEQYQCEACRNYVVLQQFQHRKLISQHNIPKIQYLIQVKMKTIIKQTERYQLVAICEKCYQAYIQNIKICQNNLQNKDEIIRSKLKSNIQTRQYQKAKSINSSINSNSLKKRNLQLNNQTTKTRITPKSQYRGQSKIKKIFCKNNSNDEIDYDNKAKRYTQQTTILTINRNLQGQLTEAIQQYSSQLSCTLRKRNKKRKIYSIYV